VNLNNFNTSKDWSYYLSMVNAASDPLDFLMSADNIPYKKFNRIKVSAKNKKFTSKKSIPECATNT